MAHSDWPVPINNHSLSKLVGFGQVHFKNFILCILSLMLTITEQILLTMKNNSKVLIDVNTLVKKTY